MSAVAGRPVVPDVDDVIVHLDGEGAALRDAQFPNHPDGAWLVWVWDARGGQDRRSHAWVQERAVAVEDRRGLPATDLGPTPPERWTR